LQDKEGVLQLVVKEESDEGENESEVFDRSGGIPGRVVEQRYGI
jgi:hypothetical protein